MGFGTVEPGIKDIALSPSGCGLKSKLSANTAKQMSEQTGRNARIVALVQMRVNGKEECYGKFVLRLWKFREAPFQFWKVRASALREFLFLVQG